jgi:hypothetical protein
MGGTRPLAMRLALLYARAEFPLTFSPALEEFVFLIGDGGMNKLRGEQNKGKEPVFLLLCVLK